MKKIIVFLLLTFTLTGLCSDLELELANLKERVQTLETRLNNCQCNIQKRGKLNLPGKSYGGILRSGPSMNYPKIASLYEGEQVTLLKQSKQKMNGYNWFQVKTSSEKIGYQWGGILCAEDNHHLGIYKICGE